MARTVLSEEQSRRKWLHYGLSALGLFAFVGGVVLGVVALEYEFAHEQAASGSSVGNEQVYDYGTLTEAEQRAVDDAIDGERQVFEDSTPLPGGTTPTLGAKEVTVKKGGTYHAFTARPVFPTTDPAGLATIALVLGGLLAMTDLIRRRHFSKAMPWQTA
jgi:hypothetical protein